MCTELRFSRDKAIVGDVKSLAKRLGMTVLPMLDDYPSTPELMGCAPGDPPDFTMCLCPVDLDALATTWGWTLDHDTNPFWVIVHE
jgi:hypothetical protein